MVIRGRGNGKSGNETLHYSCFQTESVTLVKKSPDRY